jgi:protein-tyrosine-phosphatase
MAEPVTVLFVCTANICRSAFAEELTRHRAITGLEVSSAGTHGWRDHPVDEHIAHELRERGADPSAFRSRGLTRDMIDAADVILTAGAVHRTFVLQERPAAMRKVFSLGQFAAAVPEVEPSLEGRDLLRGVHRVRSTADPAHDLPDPFRRGPEAAQEAARQLEQLLDIVLPRLGRVSG